MKYLVVVDMQNDFIDGALGTPEAQAIVPSMPMSTTAKMICPFLGDALLSPGGNT